MTRKLQKKLLDNFNLGNIFHGQKLPANIPGIGRNHRQSVNEGKHSASGTVTESAPREQKPDHPSPQFPKSW